MPSAASAASATSHATTATPAALELPFEQPLPPAISVQDQVGCLRARVRALFEIGRPPERFDPARGSHPRSRSRARTRIAPIAADRGPSGPPIARPVGPATLPIALAHDRALRCRRRGFFPVRALCAARPSRRPTFEARPPSRSRPPACRRARLDVKPVPSRRAPGQSRRSRCGARARPEREAIVTWGVNSGPSARHASGVSVGEIGLRPASAPASSARTARDRSGCRKMVWPVAARRSASSAASCEPESPACARAASSTSPHGAGVRGDALAGVERRTPPPCPPAGPCCTGLAARASRRARCSARAVPPARAQLHASAFRFWGARTSRS